MKVSPFSLNCFDSTCNSRIDTTIYNIQHHSYSSKLFFPEENCPSSVKFKEIMIFLVPLQMKIEISSYKD